MDEITAQLAITSVGALLCLLGTSLTLSFNRRRLRESEEREREFNCINNAIISHRRDMSNFLKYHLNDQEHYDTTFMLETMSTFLDKICSEEEKLKGAHYDASVTSHFELLKDSFSRFLAVLGTIMVLYPLLESISSMGV